MTPYYEDDLVTLYHGDSREFLPTLADQSVDCVITDPPYTERTHGMAKTNKGAGHGVKAIAFAPFTEDDLTHALAECGRVTRRWVVASLDYAHAFALDVTPPTGLRSLRVGVWVKSNPMPQISADRPGQGWEAISFLHRDDVEVLSQSFSVVVFRLKAGDDATMKLLERYNESGKLFVSHTKLRDRYCVRVAIGNGATEWRHVEELLAFL